MLLVGIRALVRVNWRNTRVNPVLNQGDFREISFKMVFKIKDGGCRRYDQSEPVSKPQNTIQLFDILI